MTCDSFLDRLYDDDARAAQRGQGAIPPDMAQHMLGCVECQAAYDAAGADELLLVRALLDSPPPAWRAELLREMARPPVATWTKRIATVNEAVTWGILAIATSHVLMGDGSTAAYVAAFLTGGAAALVYPGLGKPWMPLPRLPFRWV